MKKQLFITILLLGAGQMHAATVAGQVNDRTGVEERLNYIAKNTAARSMHSEFISTWKEMINGCMDYSIKNSKNYLGVKDQSLVTAAQNVKYINSLVIYLYTMVYGKANQIKQTSGLKSELISSINADARNLDQLFKAVLSKTHSTTWRKDAQDVLSKTITKLLDILKQIKTDLLL